MHDPRRIRTRADLSKALQELRELVDGRYATLAGQAGVSNSTLHAMVTGRSFPRWSSLRRVLIALGVAPDELPAWQSARQRVGLDRPAAGPGWPLTKVTDPFRFDLEVHPAIDSRADTGTGGLSALPVYVAREHDRALAEVVMRAAGGDSRIAVLVGGASTGKTRACWEALHLLRARPEPWRLWHPIEPTHGEAVLAGIARISRHTVVWLNEAQFYLDDPERGERVAAALRELLRDTRRAPVLVLATLWPQYWDTLTSRGEPDRHAQARNYSPGATSRFPPRSPVPTWTFSRVRRARTPA
ncbi:helix-turn-helix domain-containing protein [Microbispora triticiradicis]|uniref:helix-turn-helix domain-containing protein n=1 Tax=Microbispora triticiradicis TaxID=2200763 RepID=UPI001AD6B1AE|nr:helix-turn-helix transcriptional regulator [Microbispora triticiradicis]MBO4269144.1 helix-turn-helix domain-containing protein [Microbispora triticiradicis]